MTGGPASEKIRIAQLKIAGAGAVTGATDGQGLELGRYYTLKSVPAPGNLLSNWTVDGQSVINPALTFFMWSNSTVCANFVTNPFIALQGDYSGLFHDSTAPAHQSAGLVSLKLTPAGAYTAKLLLAGATFSASGQFALDLFAQSFVKRKAPLSPLTLELQLTGGSDQLNGSVSDGVWTSPLFCYHAGFSAAKPATNLAGKYTLLLSSASDPGAGPSGHGFSTITVSSAGAVQFKGSLGDGSALVLKAPLSANGQCAFYQSLFKGGGSAFGWLAFHETDTNDIHGLLLWTKPSGLPGAFYPNGYVMETTVLGSRYATPPAGGRALGLSDGAVLLQAGNLSLTLTNDAVVEANNTVTIAAPNVRKLALKLTTSSGLLGGSFFHPDTLKSSTLKGVILQKQEVGGGFFPGVDQTGGLYLGRPEDFPLFEP